MKASWKDGVRVRGLDLNRDKANKWLAELVGDRVKHDMAGMCWLWCTSNCAVWGQARWAVQFIPDEITVPR